MTYFDDKLKNVASNKNELNEIPKKKIKATATNALTKDLMNKFSILNIERYFSSGVFPNCLVFILVKRIH